MTNLHDARVERVRELHRPVEVEPSETICHECSTLRGTGENVRYFPYREWPCATIDAIGEAGAPTLAAADAVLTVEMIADVVSQFWADTDTPEDVARAVLALIRGGGEQ